VKQTAVPITKSLCSKRPFSSQKVYVENGSSFTIHNFSFTITIQNGRSRHKKSTEKTAVPATKDLWGKRPFPPNPQLAQTTLRQHGFHLNYTWQQNCRSPTMSLRRERPISGEYQNIRISASQNYFGRCRQA
jgi:hypothetical protein